MHDEGKARSGRPHVVRTTGAIAGVPETGYFHVTGNAWWPRLKQTRLEWYSNDNNNNILQWYASNYHENVSFTAENILAWKRFLISKTTKSSMLEHQKTVHMCKLTVPKVQRGHHPTQLWSGGK